MTLTNEHPTVPALAPHVSLAQRLDRIEAALNKLEPLLMRVIEGNQAIRRTLGNTEAER
jgi:K+/H+ antiporter YhaU regulatory subunit KhtT